MSLALTIAKTHHGQVFDRLQDEWCTWGGPWESFTQHVLERGERTELELMRVCPQEFESAVRRQRTRIKNRQAHKTLEYIQKLEKLCDAEKPVVTKDGYELVPDNPTRLAAIKALISTSMIALDEDEPVRQPGRDDPMLLEAEQEALEIIEKSRISARRKERGIAFESGCEGREDPVLVDTDQYRGTG